mgnify:CR=1 FL=1
MFLCEILSEQQQAPSQYLGQVQRLPSQYSDQMQQLSPDQDVDFSSDDDLDDEEEFSDEGAAEETSPFPELLPLKRYYLIQRLNTLKARLDQSNISNKDLDIIVKFVNNLSYNSLLSLLNGIVPVIEDQIARSNE